MVLRVGLLEHDGRTTFCLVKNISSHGVQVKLFGSLRRGVRLHLKVGDEAALSGRAIWLRDQLAGIAFDKALDPSVLLRVTKKLEAAARRRSSPRVDAVARIVMRTGGRTCSAELRDISASGARVRTARPIVVGPSITLDLPGLPPLKAYSRWACENELGLVFDSPIPIQIIAEWLDGRLRTFDGDGRAPLHLLSCKPLD